MGQAVDVVTQLERGRSAYVRRDYAAAHRCLTAVRDHGDLDVDDLMALADSAWWLGRVKEHLALSEEAHTALLRQGRVAEAAMNALDLAAIWMMRGDLGIGSGWVSRARRLLGKQPPGAAHGFLRYLDVAEALDGLDLDGAIAGGRELQALGTRFDAPTLTSLGLMCEGAARVRAGEVREGFALLDEAMLPVLADQVREDWAGSIYCTTMSLCHELADDRRAREWNAATRQWCERFSDAVMFIGICRLHSVQLMTTEGKWGEALAEARAVVEDLKELNVEVVAEAEYQIGQICTMRGDLEAAEDAYGRARALGREPQPGEAALRLVQGRAAEAWTGVNEVLARTADPFRRARLLRVQVGVGVAGGHLTAAELGAGELSEISRRYDSAGYRAWAHEAHGTVLLAGGQPGDALAALQRACQEYQAFGARYDTARTLELMARAHERLGRPELAAAAAQAALREYDAIGAAIDVRRLRSRPHTTEGGLTEREAEVLAHIARGSTNRDVGRALHISEKTVGRHLANIFTKLDVGTRTAAAAWAHMHGIVEVGAGERSASNAPPAQDVSS